MTELEAWLARDKDGELYLYKDKPLRGREQWHENPVSITRLIELRKEWFLEVQWSDEEPTKVKITIEK